MKVAVIGAGSTYTPELVSGLARERDALDVRELVLHDIDAERLEVVGGLARRMLDAAGLRRAISTLTGDLDRGARRRRLRAHPDPRRRPGGAAPRRDGPARLRLHRPGDDRRRRPREGAAARCPVVLEIAERVRERAADGAWIVDFTNPVGIVTRALLDAGTARSASATSRSAFQRTCRAAARGRARARARRPGRPQPPDVGARGPPRRRRRPAASCSPSTATSSPATPAGCRGGCSRSSARSRPTTCATSTRTTSVLAEQLGGEPRAATGRGDRARAARAVPRPGADREAGAARAARRRVLQRGGDRARRARSPRATGDVHVVDIRNEGTLAGLADDDVVEVPARVGRDGLEPLPQAPLAPELLGLVQHVAAYERLAARGGRSRGDLDARAQGAARAPADRAGRGSPRSCSSRCSSRRRRRHERRRSSSPSTAATRRRDLALVRADGALLALVRGPESSPHHLGLERLRSTCSRSLFDAGAAGRLDGDGRSPRSAQLLHRRASTSRAEERELREAVERARLGRARTSVDNDTFAVLRAGTERGWGVAVVCGAGHQLRRRRARRPARALPGARRDHRRLGRRLRRRPRRAVRGRAQRGRPRAADDARARGAGPLRARDAGRARRGDPPRRDPVAAARRAAPGRVRGGRARRGRRRDRRSARRRDRRARPGRARAARPRRASRSRSCSAAACSSRGDGAPRRAIEAGLRDGRPASRRCRRRARRRSSAPRCSASTQLGADAEAHERARTRAEHAVAQIGGRAMADVRFEQATKLYPGSDVAGGRRARPRHRRRRADGARRPVGLGQDDGAADARRPRGGRRGRGADRRPRRHRPAAEEPRRRDGVPELRALPVPRRSRQNIAFPLKMASVKKAEREARAARGRASCSASSASSTASPASSPAASGSASRWAARSSGSPSVFLMDEPLSNLDAKLRVQMRADIAALQARARRSRPSTSRTTRRRR